MRFILGMVVIATVTYIQGIEFEPNQAVTASAAEVQPSQTQDEELLRRLEKLEPPIARDIQSPFVQRPFPSKVKSTVEVMQRGYQLPFRVPLNDPQWQRPLYNEQWHSTYSGGRWAYMPLRLFYAQHRLFTTSLVGLSNLYDFFQNLGFKDIDVEQNGATQEKRINEVVVVVMQARIERVVTQGNQVVIVARPQRTGVQAITINKTNMKLDNQNEAILFQLVTPDGDEIDYSIY
ncbi:hypothetical protein SAMN02799624_06164 [Paenibacillus sp. UNC496MF]|nr:hypothetical protein SAMN02799624_06164 [Paenibacillus sp. UNC496MF]